MGRFAADTTRVRVGDCTCPGTPHPEGDHVSLRRRLSIEAGAVLSETLSKTSNEIRLGEVLLPHLIESWDFLDIETGEPIPVTPESIAEALPWNEGGREVIAALSEALTSPLPSRASPTSNGKPSPTTPTASTSARARSSSPRRARSG